MSGETVAYNISYGAENATREQIEQAAKAAYCDFFIRNLEEGYDTRLSDNVNVSQGEKQLLCIARVMLVNPPMLILDEATSNIDTMTEMRIQKAFQKIMKGKTSFIVAHRLSTILDADTILVMDHGSVIEQGTHAELLAKKDFTIICIIRSLREANKKSGTLLRSALFNAAGADFRLYRPPLRGVRPSMPSSNRCTVDPSEFLFCFFLF